MKKKNKKNKKFFSKKNIFIGLMGILFLIILILIFIQFNVFEKILEKNELVSFEVEDSCTVILGNLLHQIKNQDDCRITCQNECNLIEKRFKNSDFLASNNSCHSCNCSCR